MEFLNTKLKGSGGVKMLIWNGKVFDTTWPNPVDPNQETMKAILQVEYIMHNKRVRKLWVHLSTTYGLVLENSLTTNYQIWGVKRSGKLFSMSATYSR